jgi:hypothetical protein
MNEEDLVVIIKPLRFSSIEQAEKILKPYEAIDKLRAMEKEGWTLSNYGHKELADFVGTSRESVTRAFKKMRDGIKVYHTCCSE